MCSGCQVANRDPRLEFALKTRLQVVFEVWCGPSGYGPPGTGKSQFALSLAHECRVPLIATSLSAWQARGALDDMLKAMYASFAEAKAKAPAILFIDEIDAVGDRQKFTGRNAQYSNQVVNGILEAIDGIQGREGVAVIGATNFHDRIDPAVLRSGRLGRHVKIDLPTSQERTTILEYYLPLFAGRPELRHLAKRLCGHSGADIEALARRVNQRARIERRGVSIDDLQVEMPVVLALDETSEFQIAIHEAGHAIIAHYFRPGRVSRIQLFDPSDPETEVFGSYGRVTVEHSESIGTRSSMLEEIAVGLGGMCAEEVVFGDRSVSAGGTKGSDLARVTTIAVAMVSQYGFGPNLFFSHVLSSQDDPNLITPDSSTKRDASQILAGQRDRCESILTENKPVLLAIGLALMRDKLLVGQVLDDLLANVSMNEQLKPRSA